MRWPELESLVASTLLVVVVGLIVILRWLDHLSRAVDTNRRSIGTIVRNQSYLISALRGERGARSERS